MPLRKPGSNVQLWFARRAISKPQTSAPEASLKIRGARQAGAICIKREPIKR